MVISRILIIQVYSCYKVTVDTHSLISLPRALESFVSLWLRSLLPSWRGSLSSLALGHQLFLRQMFLDSSRLSCIFVEAMEPWIPHIYVVFLFPRENKSLHHWGLCRCTIRYLSLIIAILIRRINSTMGTWRTWTIYIQQSANHHARILKRNGSAQFHIYT